MSTSMTPPANKWLTLLAMAFALAMIFVDSTAVPVALPRLQQELHGSDLMMQWVVNSYLLTLATFIILGGKLGDILGYRNTFLLGAVLFVLASMSCALAHTLTAVIISRTIQGVAGAVMNPAIIVIVMNAFPEHERGKATGLTVSCASLFLALGPVLGGIITQHVGWRWVFWINLPISIVCIAATLAYVEKPKQILSLKLIDWLGFTFIASSIFTLVFGIMEAENLGWWSWQVLLCLIITVSGAILFVKRQQRITNPLVDISLFNTPAFTNALIVLFCIQSFFAVPVNLAVFLQNAFQLTAGEAGWAMMAVNAPIMISAPLAGRLRDKLGPRLPMQFGLVGLILAVVWLGVGVYWNDYRVLIPGMICYGFSMPFVIASAMASAIATVDVRHRGIASGMANAARNLGSTLGIAVFGSILSGINSALLTRYLASAPGALGQLHESQIDGMLAESVVAQRVLQHLSASDFEQLRQAAIHAYTVAFSNMMLLTILLAIVALGFAWKIPSTIYQK
ncbi:MAG: MFS transporter [Gammaproteobacteria bacterium]